MFVNNELIGTSVIANLSTHPFRMKTGNNEFKMYINNNGGGMNGLTSAAVKRGTTDPVFVSDGTWTFKKKYEVS